MRVIKYFWRKSEPAMGLQIYPILICFENNEPFSKSGTIPPVEVGSGGEEDVKVVARRPLF